MTRKHPKESATPGRDGERLALLRATLEHVPFDGWTVAAMRAGAADIGLALADVARLFPGGPDEAVALFVAEADRTMVEELGRRHLGNMRHRDRIATALANSGFELSGFDVSSGRGDAGADAGRVPY